MFYLVENYRSVKIMGNNINNMYNINNYMLNELNCCPWLLTTGILAFEWGNLLDHSFKSLQFYANYSFLLSAIFDICAISLLSAFGWWCRGWGGCSPFSKQSFMAGKESKENCLLATRFVSLQSIGSRLWCWALASCAKIAHQQV